MCSAGIQLSLAHHVRRLRRPACHTVMYRVFHSPVELYCDMTKWTTLRVKVQDARGFAIACITFSVLLWVICDQVVRPVSDCLGRCLEQWTDQWRHGQKADGWMRQLLTMHYVYNHDLSGVNLVHHLGCYWWPTGLQHHCTLTAEQYGQLIAGLLRVCLVLGCFLIALRDMCCTVNRHRSFWDISEVLLTI